MKHQTLLSWFVLLTLVATIPLPAENDGNQLRALETAVVSPALDGRPLHAGLAVLPKGYIHDGYLYLFTHNNFLSNWRPAGLSLCSGTGSSETRVLYRQRATAADIKTPFAFLGRVAPCSDVLGEGHGIGGAAAIGGNGKFYLTSNRTKCTVWNDGCMDQEWLGAVSDPANVSYAWRPFPILAKSTVSGQTFSFNGFISLQGFDGAPAPPTSLFPRVQSPDGPATLWGYVAWGSVPGGPSKIAAVQISDYSAGLKPNWKHTRTYILATDGTWKEAHRLTGNLTFLPQDVKNEFGSISNVSELFYDPTIAAWGAVGHTTSLAQSPESGCDERFGDWYVNSSSNFFQATWADNRSTVVREVLGSNTTSNYLYSTYTQNTNQIGAFLFQIGNQQYVARGSTERICMTAPGNWWHPWIGAEITIEKLPGS